MVHIGLVDSSLVLLIRPVVPGGARGAMAHQTLAHQLTLDYAPTSLLAPPNFQILQAAWFFVFSEGQ